MEVKKVTVRSRFSMLAKRKGGPKRDDAIAAAAAAVESHRPEYHDWVAEDLDEIDVLLDRAEKPDSFDAAAVEAAYLKVARVRDLGTTFDHEMTTAVADRLCELLHRMRHLGTYHRAAVASLRNALRLVCATAFEGKSVQEYADFLHELDQVVQLFPKVEAPAKDADDRTVH